MAEPESIPVSVPASEPRPQRAPAKAPKPRIMEAVVTEVVRETADSSTLFLFIGNERAEYQAGQFLTIRPQQFPELERFCRYFEDVKGKKEPARAYSMSSAPHEKYVAFTVKEETYISGQTKYPPLLSPFLTYRALPGTRMMITGFGGPYVLDPDVESKTDHIVHICAGSGIVPNFSMIKHCLHTGMNLRHTLVYGNKTWDDIIFRRQLAELALKHPDKLRVIHSLTREQDQALFQGDCRKGRVCEPLLREFIPDPTGVEVYTCGPGLTKFDLQAAKERGEEPSPRFLETTLEALKVIGVPDDRVHFEGYG